jgi:hypothetical protein
MPDISAMLDGMLKPPTQPKYAPGYTKPKKPEVGEIVTRATNAKEASSAFLDQVQDTMERLRPGLRAGYFKRDEEAFFHGDIEVYQSTALIDAKSKLDAYLAARPIAYSVDVYDPEVYVDAQRIEDAAYHFRKLHERRWVEAGNMTLSQSEAKDLTLYGVVVSRRTLNLADTRCPITATLIDPATVFPLWGRVGNVPHLEAIYRIVTMPVYQVMADYALDEARARKIKDALGDKIGHFGASADVTVVEYWDSWWCGAFLFEGSVEIKPLTEHKYGCVPFVIQYGPGGEPMHTRSPQRGSGYMYNYAFGSRTNRDDRVYKATGYIEPMKRLHDVREAITGSYMNNLLKGFEQPVILEQTNSAAEAPEPPIIDRSAGGVTRLVGGEEQLKPFPTSPNPADAGLVMQMLAMDSQTNLQSQGDMPDRSNVSGTAMQRGAEQDKLQWDGWVQALESFHGRCATHDMLLWRNFGQEARYLSGTKKSFYVPNRNPAADEKPSFELTPEMIDNVDTDIAVLMNDMSLSRTDPLRAGRPDVRAGRDADLVEPRYCPQDGQDRLRPHPRRDPHRGHAEAGHGDGRDRQAHPRAAGAPDRYRRSNRRREEAGEPDSAVHGLEDGRHGPHDDATPAGVESVTPARYARSARPTTAGAGDQWRRRRALRRIRTRTRISQRGSRRTSRTGRTATTSRPHSGVRSNVWARYRFAAPASPPEPRAGSNQRTTPSIRSNRPLASRPSMI